MNKTNVMRLLETAGISYSLLEYPVDPEDLSGDHVIAVTGRDPAEVFKTLVMHGEKNGYAVCCIPAREALDLKKAAKAFGEKKVELLPVKELLRVTGYVRGGCSPVGMKKPFPTVIDETALLCERIFVSAGVRGAMLGVDPQALAAYLHARMLDVTEL
ncbi:MAG: Cys-tRNA(Pro) deacylase [Clostridia bacterium]|nr:Cys-tRNA(Pro) deacylase [Clostridia bacterium]